MYVFQRTLAAAPARLTEAKAYAVAVAKMVTELSGHQVTAFESTFGGPSNVISWSMVVTDMADLDAATAKLNGDAAVQQFRQHNAGLWTTSPEDSIVRIVASSITASDDPYYASTTSVALPGQNGAAVAYGLQVQEYVAGAGFRGAFGLSTFGRYGEVGWLLSATSVGDLDKFQQFTETDVGFQALLGKAAGIFVPGTGLTRLVHRID